MKTLIKNGFIVDGSGKKGYHGCVAVEDCRICFVGQNEPEGNFDEVIDAGGMVVCPGFIDTHSHSDLKLLEEPYQAPKILQGITTEVLGQDGVSMAPLPREYLSDWKKNIAGLDGESDSISWNYPTADDYLTQLEQAGICTNAAYLVPHGNIRMEAMGLTDKAASPDDIDKMKQILRRDMEAGALGLSTGLIYIPCAYAETEELIELCKVVAEYDGIFVVHQRSEAEQILSSMDEILEIGRKSGVRIHFSHFKACGKKTWKLVPQMLEKLDMAKKEGLKVSFDQYPYVAGSTMLSVVMPPRIQNGGMNKMIELLSDEAVLEKVEKEILSEDCDWDNFFEFAGPENIFITYVGSETNQNLIGKSLSQIAEMWGISPVKTAAKLIVDEKNAVSMVDFYGTEEHVKLFLSRPEQNVCTDGLLSGMPHPRVYGAFARILGKYVREEKTLTLEQAVYKMTGKAAEAMPIPERGFLRKGYFADIVIFDKDTVIDKGNFTNPKQHPEGIERVMVNGSTVFAKGEKFCTKAGKVIRRRSNGR